MLLGARQVGKTWIMKYFGEKEYKNVAYINCDDEPRMKQLFELDYNIDRILLTLQAITDIKVTPNDTLIILDEIQETPESPEPQEEPEDDDEENGEEGDNEEE